MEHTIKPLANESCYDLAMKSLVDTFWDDAKILQAGCEERYEEFNRVVRAFRKLGFEFRAIWRLTVHRDRRMLVDRRLAEPFFSEVESGPISVKFEDESHFDAKQGMYHPRVWKYFKLLADEITYQQTAAWVNRPSEDGTKIEHYEVYYRCKRCTRFVFGSIPMRGKSK